MSETTVLEVDVAAPSVVRMYPCERAVKWTGPRGEVLLAEYANPFRTQVTVVTDFAEGQIDEVTPEYANEVALLASQMLLALALQTKWDAERLAGGPR